MFKSKKTKKVMVSLICLVMLLSMIPLAMVSADSQKGQWGSVTPTADNNHPNLYYNQSEIDELRDMILVQHSPQNLYDLYNNSIKDVYAIPTEWDQAILISPICKQL